MKTHNIVNVSGGKDSTATLLKAIEDGAENLTAVFADTGNEHPDTLEYVEYLRDTLQVEIRTVRADFTDALAHRREYLSGERATREWPEEARLRTIDLMTPTGNPFLDLCIMKGRFPSRKAQFCTQELKRVPIHSQVFEPLILAGALQISSRLTPCHEMTRSPASIRGSKT